MSETLPVDGASRRRFLRDSLTVGAGAAGAAVGAEALAEAVGVEPQESSEPPRQAGYQLTRHVAEYYKTAAL